MTRNFLITGSYKVTLYFEVTANEIFSYRKNSFKRIKRIKRKFWKKRKMRCIETILQRQVVVQNFLKILIFMNNSDEYFVGNKNDNNE